MEFEELTAPIAGTRFEELFPAQKHILKLYAKDAYKLSDVAVELPTGAGKTLIALLILEYQRKAGNTVAILTGNKLLARQLMGEARDLKVPVVRFEGKGGQLPAKDLRAYRRAEAIGVMNYWVYINQNPTVEPANYLVIDDAQLADGALGSLFTIRIDRYEQEDVFEEVMRLLGEYSGSAVVDDYVKGRTDESWSPTDLLPFVEVCDVFDRLEEVIDGHLKSGTDLAYAWSRLRASVRQALVLVNSHEIVIRPYIYPAQDVRHLAFAKQRLFMSATLHDPEDLRRRLGTPPITKLVAPLDKVSEADGRRLFIFNQMSSASSRSEPAEEVLVPLLQLIFEQKKSVWLCTSGPEMRKWTKWLTAQLRAAGDPTDVWELSSTGDEFERFCDADTGHLMIAGRFEGMDFPDAICRLAIFPSIPMATGPLERFVTEQLKDARFQKLRMFERIKQGIGRCTRGKNDYAVCYFLDPRFYIEMESKEFGVYQSERTRKQIELGLQLTQGGMGAVVPFAKDFLAGRFAEFDKRELKANPPVSAEATAMPSTTVSDEIAGWRSHFGSGDFVRAAERFEGVSRGLEDAEREHRAFWKYMEAFAEYMRYVSYDEKDALSTSLNHLGQAILQGASSSWFTRLRRVKNRLAGSAPSSSAVVDQSAILDRWDGLVEKYPQYKGRFLKWQGQIKAGLDGTHDQVCEALETLGSLVGYAAARPSGDGAPDGTWVASDHVIAIEVKANTDRDAISLGDVNQADGQRRSIKAERGASDEQVGSLIVTQMREVDEAAIRALGRTKVLSLDVISEVQTRLENIMRGYWKGWLRDDADARKILRNKATSQLPPPGWLLRAIQQSTEAFMTEDGVFREWPA